MKLLTNLTKIDTYNAFVGCTSLINVEGLDNITSFAGNDFRGLPNLKKVNITNVCKVLGGSMFNGCLKLTEFGDISNVESIPDYCFWSCPSIVSVRLSNKCTSIGDGAFGSCNSLTDISNTDKVVNFGKSSFLYAPLTKFVFEDVCESIGNSAFSSCKKLTYIKCLPAIPPSLGENAFSYGSSCPIYVPDDSVDTYKSATNWSAYASRIKALSTFVD